jgi:hypothetical protein
MFDTLYCLSKIATPLYINNYDPDLVNDYEQLMLEGDMQLIPISQTILREAAQLRTTTNLITPDAIHVSTYAKLIAQNLGIKLLSRLKSPV